MAGKIILKRGDLFDTSMPIIGHGVNCSNGFASGVAGQIAARYPNVKWAYHEKFSRFGWKLGEVQFVELRGHDRIHCIANLSTQQFYGRDPNRVYVDYDAVSRSLNTLMDYADDLGFGVAVPRIGCGLANGDWGIVSNLMMEAVFGRRVDLEVWTP